MARGWCAGLAAGVVVCLCCVVTGGCGGQGAMDDHSMARGPGGGDPPPMSEGVLAAIRGPSVDVIMSRLNLRDDQISPVRSILEAADQERGEILPDMGNRRQPGSGTAGADEVLDRCADLDERAGGMLLPLLSEQQLAAFVSLMAQAQRTRENALTELVKQARPPEGEAPGGRPGGPGGGGFPRG